MSWHTPARWFHASCAPVCTSVEPGTYSSSARTRSAIACAAAAGDTCRASAATAATVSASTAVRGVTASSSA